MQEDHPLAMLDDPALGQLVSGEQVMSLFTGLGTGAGGILLASAVVPQVPFFQEKPLWGGVTTMVVGLLGGWALWNISRDAGMGLAAAMGGYGLSVAIGGMAGFEVSLSDGRILDRVNSRNRSVGRPRRFRQPVVEEDERMRGGAGTTETARRGGNVRNLPRQRMRQPVVEEEERRQVGATFT